MEFRLQLAQVQCSLNAELQTLPGATRGGCKTMFVSVEDESEAVIDAELAKDRGQVVLDGRQGNGQAAGDLFVLRSRADESDHLSLAPRERGNPGCLAVFRTVVREQYFPDHLRRHRTVEPNLAGIHVLDRLEKEARRFFFRHDASHTQPYDLVDLGDRRARQDEQPRPFLFFGDL